MILLLVIIPALLEDVAPHGLVLGLLAEADHILIYESSINQAVTSNSTNSSEFSALGYLRRRSRGGTFTVLYGVITTSSGQVCEANTMLLGDLTVDLVHRECIINFCHIVGHWLVI